MAAQSRSGLGYCHHGNTIQPLPKVQRIATMKDKERERERERGIDISGNFKSYHRITTTTVDAAAVSPGEIPSVNLTSSAISFRNRRTRFSLYKARSDAAVLSLYFVRYSNDSGCWHDQMTLLLHK